MKPLRSVSPVHDGTTVRCAVTAWGVVRASEGQLKSYRQSPGPALGEPFPTGFLRHSDEQTVAGLAAVFQAIHAHGLARTDFSGWGVLAAPRFLGRVVVARSLKRFKEEGAWGVSPHVIPHQSLHSISGTVSQSLKIHGPNFGVGGGPDGASKVMLAAASLVDCLSLPGLWVVLTGWNWEPGFEKPYCPEGIPAVCSAAALALTRDTAGRQGLCLSIAPDASAGESAAAPTFGLETLCDALSGSPLDPRQTWQLNCGGWIEMEQTGAAQIPSDKAA